MSAFRVERHTSRSVTDAWAAVTDFAAHGDVVPATRMLLDPGAPDVGWRFAAGTGVGRATFWDHMIVTKWQPPATDGDEGVVAIVKIGAWLRGWAQIAIEPDGEGARVTWTEELGPRMDPLPRLTGPVSAAAGQWLFGRTLDALLAVPAR